MGFCVKTSTLILLLLIGAVYVPGGESLIDLAAPAVLKYSSNASDIPSEFLFRVYTVSPEIRIEWEHDFRLGAVVIPRDVLKESERIIRRTRLKNGREEKLSGNVLGVSQDIFQQLEAGEQVSVKFDRIGGWMKKTGETHYSLSGLRLPAITVTDNLGNRYIIQKNPDFPICLAYETEYYSEKLVEYQHSHDIIFRWYK
jgi:hypothetical protein